MAGSELFDLQVIAFDGDRAQSTAALQRIFGVDKAQAGRLVRNTPLVVKRATTEEAARPYVDALSRIGARVALLPSAGPRPGTAPSAPARAAGASAPRVGRGPAAPPAPPPPPRAGSPGPGASLPSPSRTSRGPAAPPARGAAGSPSPSRTSRGPALPPVPPRGGASSGASPPPPPRASRGPASPPPPPRRSPPPVPEDIEAEWAVSVNDPLPPPAASAPSPAAAAQPAASSTAAAPPDAGALRADPSLDASAAGGSSGATWGGLDLSPAAPAPPSPGDLGAGSAAWPGDLDDAVPDPGPPAAAAGPGLDIDVGGATVAAPAAALGVPAASPAARPLSAPPPIAAPPPAGPPPLAVPPPARSPAAPSESVESPSVYDHGSSVESPSVHDHGSSVENPSVAGFAASGLDPSGVAFDATLAPSGARPFAHGFDATLAPGPGAPGAFEAPDATIDLSPGASPELSPGAPADPSLEAASASLDLAAVPALLELDAAPASPPPSADTLRMAGVADDFVGPSAPPDDPDANATLVVAPLWSREERDAAEEARLNVDSEPPRYGSGAGARDRDDPWADAYASDEDAVVDAPEDRAVYGSGAADLELDAGASPALELGGHSSIPPALREASVSSLPPALASPSPVPAARSKRAARDDDYVDEDEDDDDAYAAPVASRVAAQRRARAARAPVSSLQEDPFMRAVAVAEAEGLVWAFALAGWLPEPLRDEVDEPSARQSASMAALGALVLWLAVRTDHSVFHGGAGVGWLVVQALAFHLVATGVRSLVAR